MTSRIARLAAVLLPVLLALIVPWTAVAQPADSLSEETWRARNAEIVEIYQRGAYAEGLELAKRLYENAERSFGPRDEKTLTSLNNLAFLYSRQGRYGEAEPLLVQALALSREVLGERHPNTSVNLNNLALLYSHQGRYGEAKPLLVQALALRREVLGERHPDTIKSLNNLAFLYSSQGRYGEAEPLYVQALALSREVLGERHPDTINSINNIALLYLSQGRYGETEPLLIQVLALSREVLGERHPDTIDSINNLAGVYDSQDRYGEAEPLFAQALALSREVLGERHPNTSVSLNNLAGVYYSQGRYSKAEPLYVQTLALRRELLGERHPDTIQSLNNLALLYSRQGRYDEAEPLLVQALALSREVLGERHPDTLLFQLNLVVHLVRSEKVTAAVQELRRMEDKLLAWLGGELQTTEQARVRRQLVQAQSKFQDAVFTLARDAGGVHAVNLAADVMLRWKRIEGEEEAWLARIVRGTDSPRIRDLAGTITQLRREFTFAVAQTRSEDAEVLLRRLERAERELAAESAVYRSELGVRGSGIAQVQAALPPGGALLELRRYNPVDFRTSTFGAARWAAILAVGFEPPVFRDLGPVEETEWLLAALAFLDQNDPSPEVRQRIAAVAAERSGLPAEDLAEPERALYRRLFEGLEPELAGVQRLYVAADGALATAQLGRLRLPDGRLWLERQELRFLQTGRDLLRSGPQTRPKGLVAMGDVSFGDVQACAEPAAAELAAATESADTEMRAANLRTRGQLGCFKPLPYTEHEAEEVAALYAGARREAVKVLRAEEAREAALKRLAPAPRVLHLATHGFYLASDEAVEQPMVLSGLTLAGANRGLLGEVDADGEDGILYALEALDLNLNDTELVVLSACETGQGVIDYGEGIYGLSRAFRIAGAQNVLMTLWSVGDAEAKGFTVAFYRNWLAQPEGKNDPAAALRQTQLAYVRHPDERLRKPRVWAPYVVLGR